MYCTNCGNELHEQAVVCPYCGVPTSNYQATVKSKNNGLKIAIKVFFIIACICSIYSFFIPLAWCLPMTISYWKKVERGESISTSFKVCSLLFVSLIAGILMFCDE